MRPPDGFTLLTNQKERLTPTQVEPFLPAMLKPGRFHFRFRAVYGKEEKWLEVSAASHMVVGYYTFCFLLDKDRNITRLIALTTPTGKGYAAWVDGGDLSVDGDVAEELTDLLVPEESAAPNSHRAKKKQRPKKKTK